MKPGTVQTDARATLGSSAPGQRVPGSAAHNTTPFGDAADADASIEGYRFRGGPTVAGRGFPFDGLP
jgi:hypothetical protein